MTRRHRAYFARFISRGAIALYWLTTTVSAKPTKRTQKLVVTTAPKRSAPMAQSPQPVVRSIAVTVVEVAGSQAYLSPGASGGVVRGAKVIINRREYRVVQASDSFAAIVVGDDRPKEQDKGQASVVGEESDKIVELARPQPLATWAHDWGPAPSPASLQTPRFVPLGDVERNRRWDVRLTAAAGALLPLGQRGPRIARTELNARIHAEPFGAPVVFDADASLQRWFGENVAGRDGAQARSTLYVRELLASYAAAGWFAGLGRMRYAASTLGMLDGARVSAPLGGGLSIGAFGGLLPHPLSAAPSVGAERFGVEASYGRPDLPLRPEAAIVLHGSTFEGSLDERRVSGVFGLYPGWSRVGGHVELSSFDASNPWGARAIELTAAGFDTSVRVGMLQVGGRFDLRQPERSRWLASYLPAAWFCRSVPPTAGAPPGPEPCDATGTRAYGAVDAGVQTDRLSLIVGATTAGDLSQQSGTASTLGAFATGRVIRVAERLRLDASGSYSRATYVNMIGASAGPGFMLYRDAVDVSFYYRATALEYRSVPAKLVAHAVGGTVMVIPTSALLVALQGEATTGRDAQAFALFATMTWHPRF